MSELKPIPCPICKLIPHVNENKSVFCYRGTSPKHRVYAQTIEQWNTRPIEDALRAENEALRERIEPYITMMDADDIVWFCEHGCADPNG